MTTLSDKGRRAIAIEVKESARNGGIRRIMVSQAFDHFAGKIKTVGGVGGTKMPNNLRDADITLYWAKADGKSSGQSLTPTEPPARPLQLRLSCCYRRARSLDSRTGVRRPPAVDPGPSWEEDGSKLGEVKV